MTPTPASTSVPRASACTAVSHLVLLSLLCSALGAPAVRAQSSAPATPAPAFSYFGDIRLRYEWDWDSQNAAGAPRADRDRARARVRLGAGYKFDSHWSVGARVRTGDRDGQQSPHLTFHASDDITDDLEVALDRYFLQFKRDGLTAWGGRNSTPFWQQNEMVWDEDVTPTGIAASYQHKLEDGASVTATGGAFALPDGMTHLNGRLYGAQVKYTRSIAPSQFTAAATLYQFDGEEGARFLRNRNGARDYLIGVASAEWTTPVSGRPLAIGVDLIKNFENYSAAEVAPLAARHADETNGYVFSVQWGSLKNAHDWFAGYSYAHIETLAVNASFSQDDWARFGSGPQSDLTDIKGHELRAGYAFTKNLNLMARLFLVDAITSIQDGKRFRVDLNFKF